MNAVTINKPPIYTYRFMKSLREKEQELNQMSGNYDRLQDEMLQLRNENLEIYRRLRILRVNSSNKQSQNGQNCDPEDG